MGYFKFPMKRCMAVFCISISPFAYADKNTDALQNQLIEIRQQMQRMQQNYQKQITVLEKRLAGLESASKTQASVVAAPSVSKVSVLPDTSSDFTISLSGLFAAGGSSVDNDELAGLQAGGHDPNKNGFTVQNVELTLAGTVGPYFDAQANIIYQIDADGESVVELEEAFFTTRSLPYGLQIKGGQYYTEFGRHNVLHPHTWEFADAPVILTRLFGGDGLRSQGARVSWLTPADWYSEIYFGVQNAKGETVTSFLSEAGEDIGGFTLLERDSNDIDDFLYSARWLNGFDVSDTLSMNVGVSGLWGPNASGRKTDTRIAGADLYLKWQPVYSQRGFPFVSSHTEILKRWYEAGDSGTPNNDTLKDSGIFTQALWGIKPGWVAGLRAEYASAEGNTSVDPLRDTRKRLSPNLTWYPSEYSKIRLQYNRDWTEHLEEETANSLFLQVEFNLGSHSAHKF